jgi:hypothetical protein
VLFCQHQGGGPGLVPGPDADRRHQGGVYVQVLPGQNQARMRRHFLFHQVPNSAALRRYASVKTGFLSLSFCHFVLCHFCIRPHRGAVCLRKSASRVGLPPFCSALVLYSAAPWCCVSAKTGLFIFSSLFRSYLAKAEVQLREEDKDNRKNGELNIIEMILAEFRNVVAAVTS